MIDLDHEPDLGFIFYPSDIPDYPGHPRLDVIIPAKPTYRHFDPVSARFYVIAAHGKIEYLSIHHPWTMHEKYKTSAGRILLTDRKKKHVEAFSLGGDLLIEMKEDETICALVSPAPIFSINVTEDLQTWLATEMEILLAERRAHWDPQHPFDFETRLASVAPFLLYASCLKTLDAKFAADPYHPKLEQESMQFIKTEIARLQQSDKWPWSVPTVDVLL